jgi:hypothetical protein
MNDPFSRGKVAALSAEMLAFATAPVGGADEVTVRHARGRPGDSGCRDRGGSCDKSPPGWSLSSMSCRTGWRTSGANPARVWSGVTLARIHTLNQGKGA